MRLQLNSSVSSTSDTAPVSGGSTRGGRNVESSGSRDSISVSGASSALNSLFADRTARIQQLAATVQSGQYQVSSVELSNAIVGHAVSAKG